MTTVVAPRPSSRNLRVVAVEVALWSSLYGLYLAVREFSIASADEAMANARDLIDAEQALGLLHETRLQDALAPLDDLLAAYYLLGFAPLIVGVLGWLLIRRPAVYRELRTVLLLSIGLASIAYIALPVAPPRLVPELGIADTIGLSEHHDQGSFAGIDFNPYAAMPSMHVGWSLLIGVFGFRAAASLFGRWFFAVHPAVMAVAVTVTGNHYFLDSVAGATVALLAVALLTARHAGSRLRRPVARGMNRIGQSRRKREVASSPAANALLVNGLAD
jgi:membrane-associated phospholipid phosphatase